MLLVEIEITTIITEKRQVENRPIKTLVISGGVAANSRVREAMSYLARRNSLQLAVPTPSLCTDNGVMVAWAGVENYALDRFKVIFIHGSINLGFTHDAGPHQTWFLY